MAGPGYMQVGVLLICAVLVFSVFLVNTASAQGILTQILDKIASWFTNSPLGGLFEFTPERTETLDLTIYPQQFSLEIKKPAAMAIGQAKIGNFKGLLEFDFMKDSFLSKESGSELTIESSSGGVIVSDAALDSLDISGTRMLILSGSWNESTENGSIKISGFLGEVFSGNGTIHFVGNASKVEKG